MNDKIKFDDSLELIGMGENINIIGKTIDKVFSDDDGFSISMDIFFTDKTYLHIGSGSYGVYTSSKYYDKITEVNFHRLYNYGIISKNKFIEAEIFFKNENKKICEDQEREMLADLKKKYKDK